MHVVLAMANECDGDGSGARSVARVGNFPSDSLSILSPPSQPRPLPRAS